MFTSSFRSFLVLSLSAASASLVVALGAQSPAAPAAAGVEKHLTNIKQLTFGGENAEAYFSADGTRLIFQSTRTGNPCDQIFTMKIDGSDERRVSNGTGRTTCGYYYPGGKQILFASTHGASAECPPKPSYARGYVWPIYDGYDIYRANADGSAPTLIDEDARLRRRGDDRARRPHRFYERARRRHGDLELGRDLHIEVLLAKAKLAQTQERILRPFFGERIEPRDRVPERPVGVDEPIDPRLERDSPAPRRVR